MSVAVRLEGAPFPLTDTPDSDGDYFRVSDIEGLSGMEAELGLLEKHRDGSTFGKARYPRRELLVKGIAVSGGSGNYESLRVRKKIEDWAADWAWAERWIYVDEPSPGLSTQLKTRPGGKLSLPAPKGGNQEFEIPFTCADPRKYSQTLLTPTLVPGTNTLNNAGNFPTFITAVLSTSMNNPYLKNVTTGNQLITLPGNTPLNTSVDFLNRRTLHAGTTLQEMASRPRIWWFLQPGNNTIETNGTWAVQYRSAYR